MHILLTVYAAKAESRTYMNVDFYTAKPNILSHSDNFVSLAPTWLKVQIWSLLLASFIESMKN
jgi:hypothetical protein